MIMKKMFFTFFILYSFVVLSQNKELDQLIKISDSLETIENYKVALDFWNKNQSKAPKLSKYYITYFRYWNDAEKQSFNQIIGIQNAILKISNRDKFETNLLLKIFSKHFHYIAENESWQEALDVAEKGYKIKDFNQAKLETRTDYLYDLGYLYDMVGNSFEGIKFYKKSLALYVKQFGENTTDVALNYNNLAFAYSNVYNQKNTIAYYEKAAKIWEIVYKSTIDNKDYLVAVYHNLIYEYINYGDLEKAQINLTKLNNYFLKKYKTSDSKKESLYSHSFLDYSLSNIRMNLALKNKEDAIKILRDFEENQYLNHKEIEYSNHLMQCYQEIANFLIESTDYETALKLIQKALPVANKYKLSHYLITLNASLAKIYKNKSQNNLAIQFYEIAQQNNTKTYFNSSKYTLEFLKAEVYYKSNQEKNAISSIKKNIEQLLFDHSKKE